MSDVAVIERFTVEYREMRGWHHNILMKGYVVLCDGRRITEPFATRELAEMRRDNIAAIYERFGW